MESDLLDLTLPKREEIYVLNKARDVIHAYGKQIRFSKPEIEALSIIHYKLTKKKPMDRKYFTKIMFKMFDFHNDMMDSIFSTFDRSNKLVITLDSWLLGMSVMLRGDLEEKMRFCFQVYDLMGHGYIKRDRIFQLMKNCIKTTPDENPEEAAKDLIEFILKKMDQDRDGELSFQDYSTSVRQNPNLLECFGYCFPSRIAVYAFMTTFTSRVTTMHGRHAKVVDFEKEVRRPSVEKTFSMITPTSLSNTSRAKPTR